MSDSPDYPWVWDAWLYGRDPDPQTMPNFSSVANKLSDVDFSKLRYFNLETKGYGAPEIQPHSYRLELPPKSVANYRLTFRYKRLQAQNARGPFPNNMMPASFDLGCEKLTEENKETLLRFERGEVVEPWNEYYPLNEGFRMRVFPNNEVHFMGKVISATVVEEHMLVTYLKPKVI